MTCANLLVSVGLEIQKVLMPLSDTGMLGFPLLSTFVLPSNEPWVANMFIIMFMSSVQKTVLLWSDCKLLFLSN